MSESLTEQYYVRYEGSERIVTLFSERKKNDIISGISIG